MIDVVWFTAEVGVSQRGYWDQGWLEAIFDRSMWRPAGALDGFRHHVGFEGLPIDTDGAVVVVPARWHLDDVARLNKGLTRLHWAVVVLTGDEEDEFPRHRIEHPNVRIWVQTPRPTKLHDYERAVGDMWPPLCPKDLSLHSVPHRRDRDWFFAGQVTNPTRQECVDMLKHLKGGEFLGTDTFGAGLDYDTYLAELAAAKVAPCPSGPFTPDTFRVFEALEAGCVPVVNEVAPNVGESGYWDMLFGEPPPFPVINSWWEFPRVLHEALDAWPLNANLISAWWQRYKRDLANRFEQDLHELSGQPRGEVIDDQVTVIITTSPSPAHPDTSTIEVVVASVRERLPDAEIIIAADGVRAEQSKRAEMYEEYRRRLLWLTEHEWSNVLPIVFESHLHQANITRAALNEVRTPLVLFLEHDTPLVRDIPFAELGEIVLRDEVDLIRFHHETAIPVEHGYLMLDREPHEVGKVPLVRTAQWSQRPHLAATEFYRSIVGEFFGTASRTMIEDVMHGVVSTYWREQGEAGWLRFRLAIYAPPGSIQRSTHLDARGDDPKFEMLYRYDGEVPFGAPQPS